MIIELDNSKTTEFILDNYDDLGATIKATREGKGIYVYDDLFGDWYCFGGHMNHTVLIRAQSFQDAYDIYFDKFMGDGEKPENIADENLGYFTGTGKWFSEITTSYIISLGLDNIKLEVSTNV